MNLADALALADQGFHLFPLQPKSKLPAISSWPMLATRDHAKIEKWSRKYEGCNYGIFTGRFGDHGALLVVDVDSPGHGAGKKDGGATLLRLELDGREFPATLENTTPTGGRHLVYAVEAPVKQGVDVLGPGLDVRSHGGYIVGPGSVLDAGAYEVDRPSPPVPAPQWLIEACGQPRTRASNREPITGIDSARAEKRVIDYLATAERSVKGAGGDQAAYRVAAKCLALGASREMALDLMLSEHWDEGCGWAPDRLQQKIEHAWKYMTSPPGADAPEAAFESVAEVANNESKALHPFEKLNKTHAFVLAGGGCHILWDTTDEYGKPITEHLKEDAFHKKYASQMWQVGKKEEPLTKVWMSWSGRRSYDKLVFAPEIAVADRFYNTWRGFNYKPVAKENASPRAVAAVKSWTDHVRENLCSGNEEETRWLLGYFAHMVQKPWEKPLTALVFKGKKGTGKNAAVDRVGELFSAHYFTADDERYLTGNFNSHLESCLALVLDEAQWAGAKKAEGRLKGLTTGKEHLIERKGAEPYKVKNLTRVIILGNEDWLVPASEDERRWAVFNVGTGKMQQRAFFQEMREGMEANHGEGYGLLLHMLRGIDLSGIDVNSAPKTSGLADQKQESLGPQLQWWLDCLIEGQILGGDFESEWPAHIPTNRLQAAAQRHNRDRGVRSWSPTVTVFNRVMAAVHPSWRYERSSKVDQGDKVHHYVLPDLDDARAHMIAYLGHNPFLEDAP